MPLYDWRCTECRNEWEEVRPMEAYQDPATCPECKAAGNRLIKGVNVMQAAYPDGTRRFNDLRHSVALERAAKLEKDKAVKQRIQAEQRKLHKETA